MQPMNINRLKENLSMMCAGLQRDDQKLADSLTTQYSGSTVVYEDAKLINR